MEAFTVISSNGIAAPSRDEHQQLRKLIKIFDWRDLATCERLAHALRHLGNEGAAIFFNWLEASKHRAHLEAVWETINNDASDWHDVVVMANRPGPGAVHVGGERTKAILAQCLAPAEPAQTGKTSAEQSSGLARVDTAGFMSRSYPAEKCIFYPILPVNEATLMAGDGGTGKTRVTKSLVAHACAGRPFGPYLIESPCKVAIVTLEDPAAVILRGMAEAVREFGLDPAVVEKNLVLIDGTEGDGALVSEVSIAGVRRLAALPSLAKLRELVAGCRLIVVDNASEAFDGDEVNRRQVRAFIRMLVKIARENEGSVLLLAHVDKRSVREGSKGSTYSGSTGWNNSVRSRLALIATEEGIELHHEKANRGAKAAPLALRFTQAGVVVPACQSSQASTGASTEADGALFECLRAAVGRGEKIATSRSGSHSTYTCMKTLPDFPAALKARDKFWAALGRLEIAGRVVRETYVNAYRKTQERWTPALNAPNAPNS